MEVNPPKQEHLLALKVMRLTKPTLFTNIPVTCEDKDLPGDLFDRLMRDDPSTVAGAEILTLGEMLTLPQNFGNIFLGETFSSYISVHNDSSQMVKDILVKADLQTSSQRLNLSASSSAVAELRPDCCIDDVIHHEVKEIGTHILVCAVSYTTQSGEKMYFRKFFKFQVLKPLDVKTKFYNAESDLSSVTDEVFLEAQIQNITTSPMFMEKVSLEPSVMYNVTELNAASFGGRGVSTFGARTYLQPSDTRQYLYCLKPKQEFAEKAGVIKGVTVIGKLDIVWKTNLGERGRLQTSQLQRMRREDHGPGLGNVQHPVHPLVRGLRAAAGQAESQLVAPPGPHPPVLRAGFAERLRAEADRHVPQENLRIRRHRAGLRGVLDRAGGRLRPPPPSLRDRPPAGRHGARGGPTERARGRFAGTP
uniref:Trafficking protein particle complex subunit 13 n=1 Tax=Ornithorhynchus anatinus TaxID=9258 RepID=A0A6I8NPE6_ORNAN